MSNGMERDQCAPTAITTRCIRSSEERQGQHGMSNRLLFDVITECFQLIMQLFESHRFDLLLQKNQIVVQNSLKISH